ncbi:unnamed protein product, partial [Pleuronectes platessa]
MRVGSEEEEEEEERKEAGLFKASPLSVYLGTVMLFVSGGHSGDAGPPLIPVEEPANDEWPGLLNAPPPPPPPPPPAAPPLAPSTSDGSMGRGQPQLLHQIQDLQEGSSQPAFTRCLALTSTESQCVTCRRVAVGPVLPPGGSPDQGATPCCVLLWNTRPVGFLIEAEPSRANWKITQRWDVNEIKESAASLRSIEDVEQILSPMLLSLIPSPEIPPQ